MEAGVLVLLEQGDRPSPSGENSCGCAAGGAAADYHNIAFRRWGFAETGIGI
jgi:hypothetical protein